MRLPRIPVLGLSDEEEGEEEEAFASVPLTEVEISIEGGGGIKVFPVLTRRCLMIYYCLLLFIVHKLPKGP